MHISDAVPLVLILFVPDMLIDLLLSLNTYHN